jgi:HTH-type transcriptional regulator/antitoxin HigA
LRWGEIEKLWGALANTKQGDELDILTTLMEIYEAEYFPTEKPSPMEAAKFRMEQLGP